MEFNKLVPHYPSHELLQNYPAHNTVTSPQQAAYGSTNAGQQQQQQLTVHKFPRICYVIGLVVSNLWFVSLTSRGSVLDHRNTWCTFLLSPSNKIFG
jgi:hypothetical protein